MKIKKLYTLSQFIDLVKENNGWHYKGKVNGFDLIIKYNEFLKQSLKKEMFVNEVEIGEIPETEDDLTEEYTGRLLKWEEAEKKVIFEGRKSMYHRFEILLADGVTYIDFSNEKYPMLSMKNERAVCVKTLHDLAEATNGKLKLKNVEL